MPTTLVQDQTEEPRTRLTDLQTRRGQREAERTRIQEQLADAPRAIAEGRSAPGESARLRAELADLNDGLAFLDSEIEQAGSELARLEAHNAREARLAKMAVVAQRAEKVRQEMEAQRKKTAEMLDRETDKVLRLFYQLVEARKEFDQLGEVLLPGFAQPYRSDVPRGRIQEVRAVFEEVEARAGSTESIGADWEAIRPTWNTLHRQPGTGPFRATKAQLVNIGNNGFTIDRICGFAVDMDRDLYRSE